MTGEALTTAEARKALRKEVRERRNSLTINQQVDAARALAERLDALTTERRTSRIAVYLTFDGELSTQATIDMFWEKGVQVYLPVLHPFRPGHLIFQQFLPTTPLVTNRLKIQEPPLSCPDILPLNQFDIIFTPLVAFDDRGNRLGMGGGFYDRTLAALQAAGKTKTSVIGLAHDCQQVTELPTESWDMPLDEIITPTQHFQW